MEQCAALGPVIPQVAADTFRIYGELLTQPEASSRINLAEFQTFAYGPHKKQQLDLYKPPSDATNPFPGNPRPIIIFVHGGAFVSGGRITPQIPGNLVYRNIGYFFSHQHGFETVIPSYRLLSDGAKYPSGADDIDGIFGWVKQHYADPDSQRQRDVFIVGNSAGGVHVGSWLLGQKYDSQRASLLESSASNVALKCVVLLSVPFWSNPQGAMKEILAQYYGSTDEARRQDVLSLLRRLAEGEGITQLPHVIVAVGEVEPEEDIILPGREFYREWCRNGGQGEFMEIKGHTHLSTPLGLGSGIREEEAWGCDLVRDLQNLRCC